jgi:hypothetical protein
MQGPEEQSFGPFAFSGIRAACGDKPLGLSIPGEMK